MLILRLRGLPIQTEDILIAASANVSCASVTEIIVDFDIAVWI